MPFIGGKGQIIANEVSVADNVSWDDPPVALLDLPGLGRVVIETCVSELGPEAAAADLNFQNTSGQALDFVSDGRVATVSPGDEAPDAVAQRYLAHLAVLSHGANGKPMATITVSQTPPKNGHCQVAAQATISDN